jgi:hypothetical protein
LKGTFREHLRANVPATPSGVIDGDFAGDYSWNRDAKTLVITVKRRPFLVSCKQAITRIADFLEDCRGPQVRMISGEGGRETWRVEAPHVNQRETAYPQIKFGKGDAVSVRAGGCVQTGGSGQTWRRYVDPVGPNSNRLYHGLIKLPGMPAAVRLADFMKSNSHTVPNNAAGDRSLRLGYEDDSYANNGYWGHDDGIDNQCKDVGKAWVEVVITRALR